jgi:hypothetical protein
MEQSARSLENSARLAAMDVMGDVLKDQIKDYPGRGTDEQPKWYKEPGWDARHDPKVDGIVDDFVDEKLAKVQVVPLRPSETGVFTMSRLHEVINPGFVEHKRRMDQLMRRNYNPYEKLETRLLNARTEATRERDGDNDLLERERLKYLSDPDEGDSSACFVCNAAIVRKADEKKLPCGHSIHFSCASSWVSEQMKRGGTVGCGRCGAAISGVPQPVVRKAPAKDQHVQPAKDEHVQPARDPGPRDKKPEFKPPRAPKRHSTLSGMGAALMAVQNES